MPLLREIAGLELSDVRITEQAIEIRSDMTDQNVNCSAIASCNS
jgi:hypothetical protein